MEKAELLAAVWMTNHPNEIADKQTLEEYIQQFDFLVKNFQSTIDSLKDD